MSADPHNKEHINEDDMYADLENMLDDQPNGGMVGSAHRPNKKAKSKSSKIIGGLDDLDGFEGGDSDWDFDDSPKNSPAPVKQSTKPTVIKNNNI